MQLYPATFVPKDFYEEMVSRPDWTEIEKRMKEIYGEAWRLVPIKGVSFYGNPI